MMDFTLTPAQASLKERIEDFILDKIVPCERDRRCAAHGPTAAWRVGLNAPAREAGQDARLAGCGRYDTGA